MKQLLALLATLFVVLGAGAAPVPEEKESKEVVSSKIRALLPEAASSRNADWKRLTNGDAPSVDKFENQSLSMVLLNIDPSKEKAAVRKEFDYVGDPVNARKLAEAISRGSLLRGYGTMLQPDYITEVTCELKEKQAKGTVSFRAAGLYQGKVEYRASRDEKGWRVEEFRLPGYKIKVTRKGADPWKRGTLKDGE